MEYTLTQVAKLIGVEPETLRKTLKTMPWRAPKALPREHEQMKHRFPKGTVDAWLARREEARKAAGIPGLLWVGDTPFDGAIAVAVQQQADQITVWLRTELEKRLAAEQSSPRVHADGAAQTGGV